MLTKKEYLTSKIFQPIVKKSGDWTLLRSLFYNYDFNRRIGTLVRWGRTKDEDPVMSPVGPEIADIEIVTGNCSGGCPWCLPPGMQISTEDQACIEDILPGDRVLGWDISTKQPRIQDVIETYKRYYSGKLIRIEMDDNVILLTPKHEVLLESGEWIQAQNLREGDDIQSLQA